jgi:hypothetical protein
MAERRRLIFAGTFAGVALVVSWLIQGQTSPFYKYFIWHVDLPNLWVKLHTIPYIIALIFRSELVYWVMFVAQWFIIGLLFSTLLRRKPLQ